jgi:hypothetical protein
MMVPKFLLKEGSFRALEDLEDLEENPRVV